MIWFFKKKSNVEEKEEVTQKQMPQQASTQPPISPLPAQITSDSPKKFKVRYEWKKCIGSAVCEAVAPAHFKVENGKAILLGSRLIDEENKIYEKEISEAELDANKMAADGCPPNCIHVINIETGEEIGPKK